VDGEPGNRVRPFLRKRLRTDPLVRAELEAARAWAVPRSVFLGRIPQPDEPLWTDKDRQWAIALLTEERATHSCGHLSEESFAPDSAGEWEAEPSRCYACQASQTSADEYSRLAGLDPPQANIRGLYFSTHRKDST